MFKAQILSAWKSDAGNYPELEEMLQPGDSIMDVTGQPAENITPDPNAATWELWTPDYTTIDTIKSDGRFEVVMEWEETEDGA